MNQIIELTKSMIDFDAGDPKRIQHFLKVHDFAKLIGTDENIDSSTMFILEAASILHDIGIHPAEEKYEGRCDGKLQEQEGPAPARKIMQTLAFNSSVIDRVCHLIAHHHTYTNIDGIDYQILVEADFLVNMYEDNLSTQSISNARDKIFVTKSGIELCNTMFFS